MKLSGIETVSFNDGDELISFSVPDKNDCRAFVDGIRGNLSERKVPLREVGYEIKGTIYYIHTESMQNA